MTATARRALDRNDPAFPSDCITYVPYMADHAYVVAAAMRVTGVPAEVLPRSDSESLRLGLSLCKGRECLPCFFTIGEIVRKCREPGFDPSRARFLTPTSAGPCRFGQYNVLQRQVLEQCGLEGVEIVSPTSENAYHGFGDDPSRLRALATQGITAVDLLQKLLHERRPFETESGRTDAVYAECLDDVVQAVERGAGTDLVAAMRTAAERFGALPGNDGSKPGVGLLGEIYLRLNSSANQEVIRSVEAAGGYVVMATLAEWLAYTNWSRIERAKSKRDWGDMGPAYLLELYQWNVDRRLLGPVAPLLRHSREPSVAELMDLIRPFYEPLLGTEAVLTMGKAVDMAHDGMSGILHVMPFSCMPGIIVTGIAPRLRQELGGIPWLDITYDGQEKTNIKTRLEAFMHQVFQQHRRRFVRDGKQP